MLLWSALAVVGGYWVFSLKARDGGPAPAAVRAPGLIAVAQITLILLGHVLGVVIAHDMALRAGPERPVLATLADELPVVLLMIGYTWAGLFLLFVR